MHALWSVAATVTAAGVIVTPAGVAVAQPAQPGNAQQTIDQLRATGYSVVIDRVGNAPIEQCLVTDVRNPREVTQRVPIGTGANRRFVTVVVSRSISVSLDCSR